MAASGDTFYRYQEFVETGGIDALINKIEYHQTWRIMSVVKLNKQFSNTPSISPLMGKSEQTTNYLN